MSKGSNFWGTARGKLGNMVISSVKGQQVERKYQPQVANPKTFSQMRQRAAFAAAVKFFKHSQQALFQFAYEDKGARESDYNAFMRHNVSCFYPYNKIACDNAVLPALGFSLDLVLSYGSLPAAEDQGFFDRQGGNAKFGFDAGNIEVSQAPDVYLWADVSTALINKYDLQNGDIVTFVVVSTDLAPNKIKPMYIDGDDAKESAFSARWTITQRRIDNQSTEDVTALIWNKKYMCTTQGISTSTYNYLHLGAIIFSRPVPGRSLLVSTSRFAISDDHIYNAVWPSEGSVEEKQVLTTWGANPDAILKGSLL